MTVIQEQPGAGPETKSLVDDALATLQNLPWFTGRPDPQVHFRWSPAEDAELRKWHGRLPRPEIARRVSAILQQRTGKLEAFRSPEACYIRAQQLGLRIYNGEPGELHLKEASRLADVPFDVIFKAARSGEFPSSRRGKQRYIVDRDLANWLLAYRDRQEAQAEMLNALDGQDLISKKEAMALTGLGETHLARYLQTGVIRAWKLPTLDRCNIHEDRGEWLVQRPSVEAFIRARTEGRLSEILDANPAYVAVRNNMTAEVRNLRRAGRLMQRDPLTQPKSAYHPGCFTVAQLASHTGLSSQSIHEAIRTGNLKAETVLRSRLRYAIAPEEARRYAAWVRERADPLTRYHNRHRQAIAQAGLLTIRDLAERWNLPEATINAYARRSGLAGHRLPCRTWGRYLVFEPADVATFEASAFEATAFEVATLEQQTNLRSGGEGVV